MLQFRGAGGIFLKNLQDLLLRRQAILALGRVFRVAESAAGNSAMLHQHFEACLLPVPCRLFLLFLLEYNLVCIFRLMN